METFQNDLKQAHARSLYVNICNATEATETKRDTHINASPKDS